MSLKTLIPVHKRQRLPHFPWDFDDGGPADFLAQDATNQNVPTPYTDPERRLDVATIAANARCSAV
jgi:PKD repeat protein